MFYIQEGDTVTIDGTPSLVEHVSLHPAGAWVHFDNRPGMSLERLAGVAGVCK